MSTDLTTIAHTAADRYDIDPHAAEAAAREYLAQISVLDGQDYDEDDIPTEAAEFIIESIHRAQDDTSVTPLDRVAEAAARVAEAEDALTVARQERATSIRAAIAAGAPIRQIAISGQVSRQTVYDIQAGR